MQNHDTFAVAGATLWDGTGSPPRPNAVLLVSGGRITAVVEDAAVPPDVPRLDARGKWVIPGLIDLHVHLDEVLSPPGAFPLFGVTTVRDVGSRLVTIQRWRARAERGEPTPRLFWMGRNIDEGKPSWSGAVAARTPADVPALIADLRKQGVDGVKLYVRAGPGVARAVIAEAHRFGLPVTGHLEDTPPETAARLGIDNLEHVWTLFDGLARPPLPLSLKGFKRGFVQAAHTPPAALDRLIGTLAAHQVAVTATLAVSLLPVAGEAAARAVYAGWAALPVGWTRYWQSPYWGFVRPDGWTAADFDTTRRAIDRFRALVLRLHKAGVPLVAGTDTPAPWVLPGAGLVRELELLIDCGLPARDALQAATGRAAKVLRRTGEVGTLVPGARADFLLLPESPLADIRALRRLDAVYLGGVLLDRAAVRRQFETAPAPPSQGLAM